MEIIGYEIYDIEMLIFIFLFFNIEFLSHVFERMFRSNKAWEAAANQSSHSKDDVSHSKDDVSRSQNGTKQLPDPTCFQSDSLLSLLQSTLHPVLTLRSNSCIQ